MNFKHALTQNIPIFTLKNNMPQFQTIEQAFEWFLENVFPTLPTEEKIKLRTAKYSFYKEGLNVSKKRMARIMNEYGEFVNLYEYRDKEK